MWLGFCNCFCISDCIIFKKNFIFFKFFVLLRYIVYEFKVFLVISEVKSYINIKFQNLFYYSFNHNNIRFLWRKRNIAEYLESDSYKGSGPDEILNILLNKSPAFDNTSVNNFFKDHLAMPRLDGNILTWSERLAAR